MKDVLGLQQRPGDAELHNWDEIKGLVRCEEYMTSVNNGVCSNTPILPRMATTPSSAAHAQASSTRSSSSSNPMSSKVRPRRPSWQQQLEVPRLPCRIGFSSIQCRTTPPTYLQVKKLAVSGEVLGYASAHYDSQRREGNPRPTHETIAPLGVPTKRGLMAVSASSSRTSCLCP